MKSVIPIGHIANVRRSSTELGEIRLQITKSRKYKLDKRYKYLGTCNDKGCIVDLYHNEKLDYYISRYGEERNNYSAMSCLVAKRSDMVSHVLRIAYRYNGSI